MPTVPVYNDSCDRLDIGGIPCAGGACPSPGGTPSFLSLSPMAALRRRAVMTGRLPHGRMRKLPDPCCRITQQIDEGPCLPWTVSTQRDVFHHEEYARQKSVFRSFDRCGFLRTRRESCPKGKNPCVDECAEPPCNKYLLQDCFLCSDSECECEFYSESTDCDCESHSESTDCDCDYDCHCNVHGCEEEEGIIKKGKRVRQRRHAFVPHQTILSCPSGQNKPISETMSNVRPRINTTHKQRRNHFARPQASKSQFRGAGDPDAFCLSTNCRIAGSIGPKEIRQAVCQFPPRTI